MRVNSGSGHEPATEVQRDRKCLACKAIAFATVAFSVLAVPQESQAERPLTFQAVRLSGSERLALFGLTRPGQPLATRRLAYDIASGMGHEGTFGTLIRQDIEFDPILRYDDNLNGGLRNDSFTLFGLEFVLDEEQVAQAGLLLGVGGRSSTRVALGGQSALGLDLDIWGGRAPGPGFSKMGASGRACLARRLDFANHLRGCGGASIEWFDLGESEAVFADADWFHLFGFGASLHEGRLGVKTTRYFVDHDLYDQATWAVGLLSAWPWGIATDLELRYGEKVLGYHVVTSALQADVTTLILSRPTRFQVGWRESEGGVFFGEPRVDSTWRVAMSRTLSSRYMVSVGYEQSESTVAFFDDEDIDITVDFDF